MRHLALLQATRSRLLLIYGYLEKNQQLQNGGFWTNSNLSYLNKIVSIYGFKFFNVSFLCVMCKLEFGEVIIYNSVWWQMTKSRQDLQALKKRKKENHPHFTFSLSLPLFFILFSQKTQESPASEVLLFAISKRLIYDIEWKMMHYIAIIIPYTTFVSVIVNMARL